MKDGLHMKPLGSGAAVIALWFSVLVMGGSCFLLHSRAEEPILLFHQSPEGDLVFDFMGDIGWDYTLEAAPRLHGEPEWLTVEGFELVIGADQPIQHIEPRTNLVAHTQQFFRVAAEETPTLVLYTFTASSLAPEVLHAQLSATDMGISSGTIGFGDENPEEWVGSGLPVARGFTGWNTADPAIAKHFEFTAYSDGEHWIVPSSIELLTRATENGPSALDVTVNGDTVHSQSLTNALVYDIRIPLSGFNQTTQMVVRVKGWNDGSRPTTGNGRLEVDDVRIRGELEFIPPDFVTTPSVEAMAVTERTESGATLAGRITATGGAMITERGFYWSQDPAFEPPGEGQQVQELGEFFSGTFDTRIEDLPEGTTFYFRPYAVNSEGATYASAAAFATLATNELAFYGFTGESKDVEAVRTTVLAEPVTISGGSLNFGWAQATDWLALGAQEPYLEGGGTGYWNASSQFEARSFQIDMSAETGWLMTVTGVTFLARATGAGPSAIGVAVDGVELYEQDMPANQTLAVHAAVTNARDLASVLIEIQGWTNGTRATTGNGDFRIDNVHITGSMTTNGVPPAP